MPIRVLSDSLAASIAAGEVIERPASVVKELIENSLDARATRIDVDVRAGGSSLIRVVDNGQGIPDSELETAFHRFATSKIAEGSNLVGIATLGFRGEALPSITSVSHVDITSRPAGQDVAARRLIEFGSVIRRESVGAPPGTSITVTRLFRNVPARLKFLASPGSELGRLQQVVATYALVYPGVSLRRV
jgi:DNA mismatch repair protein MutL